MNNTLKEEGATPSVPSANLSRRRPSKPKAKDEAIILPSFLLPSPFTQAKKKRNTKFQSEARSEKRRTANEKREAERSCRPSVRPPRPAPAGYGGQRASERGRQGTERGGGRQTRSGSERVRVGSVVVNASGRGVWGKGTVVGVIPSGVNPRYYCRRHGWPNVFGKRCDVVWRERYVVMGDDGRRHIPRRVRLAEEV